ncbi:MAG TPA: HEAT repeat domain-containing protein, partial [Holophaga sp.]|nr:HEAT repeat domain-containing protein [Holophaga sp.]
LLGRLSSSMSAQSLARSFGRGSQSLEQVADVAGQVKALSSNPGQWRDQLMDALRHEGMSDGQIQELIEILNWDSLPVEVKLDKLMEGQRIFEMPTRKVLAFMRELLEAGRNLEFLRLMRQYAAGLFSPAVVRRTAVATGFEGIADWVDIPGMPQSLMSELMELLSRAFGREKDPEVHQWLSKAVEHILWFWVESGDPRTAHALFTELQDVVTELSLPAPWKSQATAELLARLGSPERLDKVLGQLFLMDRQEAADRIHPYLRMLGPSAANHLVDRLSAEPDRSRRGRLLEALKSCGQVAEAPLLESLKSPEWYVVRNALIVLAEIADSERVPELQGLLLHPDARVVAAAIRAVGRLGGRTAEGALVPLLNHRDHAIQMEALFTLNEMKARQAVPALLELVKGGKGRVRPPLERIRVKALEVLGQLGSNSVIPDLRELAARRRGFFRDLKEPQPIRVQALKALARLDTPEAREAIQRILAEEPAGPEREALQAALREMQA